MELKLSKKYETARYMSKIMGPNPIKITEELMENCLIKKGGTVCDLGSGQGITSIFLAKEYGYKVYAADLWSEPCENRKFFEEEGLTEEQIVPVKTDATDMPFEKEYFDGVVSVDSYNYFGRDESYLDEKLLPYIKKGGYLYVAVTGMVKDLHDDLPEELLLSWTPEQLEYMRSADYWKGIFEKSKDSELIELRLMECNDEAWEDWLKQENEYAVNDRKSMEKGAGKYFCCIKAVIRKK